MKILAIETSCDETAAAILSGNERGNFRILSDVVSSQVQIHAKFGGVYPELASREHVKNILPVINEALHLSKIKLDQVEAIAVTAGPGLIGSLLVGVNTARALAAVYQKPLLCINHLEGHLYANFITSAPRPIFPALCLIVSGGHTSLILMTGHGHYQIVGQTLDDAAGEAFDKVAKLLGLSYPGGPAIEKEARQGNPKAFNFPRPMLERDDFSFSGLKTAVLYEVKKLGKLGKLRADLAASFQQAVVDTLVTKTLSAAKKYRVKAIMLAGGVAANQLLRQTFLKDVAALSLNPLLLIPSPSLCTDNASMIASAGYFHYLRGERPKWYDCVANANLKLVN